MVDSYKHMKWCPILNCEFIIERPIYSNQSENQSTVQCKCSHKFCFYCKNQEHIPASCEQAEAWIQKEKGDEDNMLWIKANTKKCPSCKALIEKNGGCNSVRCHSCGVEFCWMCLRLAKDHGGGSVHIFNACTNFRLQMKDDDKFA